MSTISEIHTSVFGTFQNLLPKSMFLMFPTTTNSILSNKQFKVSKISASSISTDRLKASDTTYSDEAVSLTIFNSIIAITKDVTNTVNMPYSGFKANNAKIKYKNKTYIIKEEIPNEFDNSITLLCDTKV